MLQLNELVLVEATQDAVVYPYESEQFGGYRWGVQVRCICLDVFSSVVSEQGTYLLINSRARFPSQWRTRRLWSRLPLLGELWCVTGFGPLRVLHCTGNGAL